MNVASVPDTFVVFCGCKVKLGATQTVSTATALVTDPAAVGNHRRVIASVRRLQIGNDQAGASGPGKILPIEPPLISRCGHPACENAKSDRACR